MSEQLGTRDHFALEAMKAMLKDNILRTSDAVASGAYELADAMLYERDRRQHPLTAFTRLRAKIKDIADDVCGVGSGVTASTDEADRWLDAIAGAYHGTRIDAAIWRREATEILASIENDSRHIPDDLWNRIRDFLKNARVGCA